jgi:signal transduction histidine kinase
MERFTYMISHDLKSPLVTVRTFLGYLEQDMEQGRAERVAKGMDFIRNAASKMGRLLEDLLEVSRVGRVENPAARVSLADLIQAALSAVAGSIPGSRTRSSAFSKNWTPQAKVRVWDWPWSDASWSFTKVEFGWSLKAWGGAPASASPSRRR